MMMVTINSHQYFVVLYEIQKLFSHITVIVRCDCNSERYTLILWRVGVQTEINSLFYLCKGTSEFAFKLTLEIMIIKYSSIMLSVKILFLNVHFIFSP